MEEETVTTTPEPSPDPAPAPEPAPVPELSEPMTVVSVDELIDRLVQSADTGEEAPPAEETEEPVPEEVLPDPDPLEITGMDKLLIRVEAIQQTLDHPALTTSFRDYTVTEGLLLIILLAAFAAACVRILKGGFSWLRW